MGAGYSIEEALNQAAATGKWLESGADGVNDLPAEMLGKALVQEELSPRPLRVRGARVTGELNLRGATLRSALHFDDCEFDAPVTLAEASVPAVRLTRCRLKGIDASQLETSGSLELAQSIVSGPVRLAGARIGGSLELGGAELSSEKGPALVGDGMTVGGRMACGVRHGRCFSAKGEVRLNGAHISGPLVLRGARLESTHVALNGDGLTVGRDLSCGTQRDRTNDVQRVHRFTAAGEIRLRGARIGGLLLLRGACLTGHRNTRGHRVALRGDGMIVERSVVCRDEHDQAFTAEGEVRLIGANIRGQLNLQGAKLSNGQQTALSLFEAQVASLWLRLDGRPRLSLQRAQIPKMNVAVPRHGHETCWPPTSLRGCVYDVLETEPRGECPLSWIAEDPNGYSPQPYEQLAAVYRRSGDESAARKVLIANQKARRKALTWKEPLNWPAKAWSIFLGATVAHGYRPSQAMLWLLACLAGGWILFDELYAEGDITQAKRDPVDFHPLIYTLDVLVPVISLGQESSYNASGDAQALFVMFAVVGWLLTVALLSGIRFRGA